MRMIAEFEKMGRMSWFSHLDLQNTMQRALRRSVPVLKRGDTVLWMPGVRPAEICRGGGGNRVLIAFVNRFEGDFRSAAANQYFNSGGTKA